MIVDHMNSNEKELEDGLFGLQPLQQQFTDGGITSAAEMSETPQEEKKDLVVSAVEFPLTGALVVVALESNSSGSICCNSQLSST